MIKHKNSEEDDDKLLQEKVKGQALVIYWHQSSRKQPQTSGSMFSEQHHLLWNVQPVQRKHQSNT